jgi:hypothetical protein
MPQIIKAFVCDCIRAITPENADTKDGMNTNSITAINGSKDHVLAFV